MPPKVARRSGIAPFYVMEVMKQAGEREAAGAEVLHLEVGQPSTGAPEPVLAAAEAALRGQRLHYTNATGTSDLRAAIAGWYETRYGVDLAAERIVITTGASGACVLAFLACFDIGDRVAVARPSYPCYRNMLTAFGCEVVELPVDASTRFQPTVGLMAAAHEDSPLTGVVVASPSNPTGTMLDAAALDALGAWCRANDVRLISDEIYHGITFGEPARTAIASNPDAVVVQSFSKYFSMTGWRVGWLVAPDELVEPVERLAQNLTVAPPTLPQVAALAAFEPAAIAELDGHIARYAANRAVLLDGLAAAGFDRIAPADGAFYVWVDVADRLAGGAAAGPDAPVDSEALCRDWLNRLGVAVTPGVDFDPVDGHHFVRFSIAGDTTTVAAAIERLVADR